MKEKIIVTLTILFVTTLCFGQDGSDIRYIPIQKFNTSFIGQFAHLDFYNDSHWGRKLDTVVISIDNKPMKFIEHRVDDGFNQWFSQQYLRSLDSTDGITIRIIKCKIDSITKDSILVTNFLEYYDSNSNLLPDKSTQEKCWFAKDMIVFVLIKSKLFSS